MIVPGCTYFKRNEIGESLQMQLLKRRISSLTLPANVTNLTTEIAKRVHCNSASRYSLHIQDGQRCYCKRTVTFKCLQCSCVKIII